MDALNQHVFEGSDSSWESTGDQSWMQCLPVRNEWSSNSIFLPVEDGKGTRKGLLGFGSQILVWLNKSGRQTQSPSDGGTITARCSPFDQGRHPAYLAWLSYQGNEACQRQEIGCKEGANRNHGCRALWFRCHGSRFRSLLQVHYNLSTLQLPPAMCQTTPFLFKISIWYTSLPPTGVLSRTSDLNL